MHSKKCHSIFSICFDQILQTLKPVSLANLCQLISQAANYLIGLPHEQLVLNKHGLTPMQALSLTQQINQAIQVSVPILYGKTLHWLLQIAEHELPITVFFLKFGTGGRVNHCHLRLSIFERQQEHLHLVTTADLDGTTVQDNQWTELVLEQALLPGQYLCQLTSPDADNQNNTLFLWLTTAKPLSLEAPIALCDYGLMPLIGFSKSSKVNVPSINQFPLLQGKTLQWSIAISQETVSSIFLQLGTSGRVNSCQLKLSIFNQQTHGFKQVAVSQRDGATVLENQWTEFVLDRSLSPGQYLCQLQSPDANHTHVLFVWLTRKGLNHYCYVSPSTTTLKKELAQLVQHPLISLILVLPTDLVSAIEPHLSDCINSVLNQAYTGWELLLSTHASETISEQYHHLNPDKIKQIDNPPQAALIDLYNQAIETAAGKYCIFLYPTDLLTENALLEVVNWINQATETIDMLYSDEDVITDQGAFNQPYFKPAWSADLLKGQRYTGQLSVYYTHLLREIGSFNFEEPIQSTGAWLSHQLKGLIETAQLPHLLTQVSRFGKERHHQLLWDMTLKFTEQAYHIQHIPQVLYHNRQPSFFVSSDQPLNLKIVQAALDQEGLKGYVTANLPVPHTNLIHYPVYGQPQVSIIIPTRDRARLLARCIDSIVTTTTYPRWEIIIVDNGSVEAETLALFDQYQTQMNQIITIIRQDEAFNFSKLVNQGVRVAKGEIILLLNNDTTILGPPHWLQEMMGFAQHPEIGCVGCKLLYPQDNTIQHAGLICGLAGIANYSHKHFPMESCGYFNHLALVTNYSAVTGACLMVKRSLWKKVHGFDENLAIAFNDVDFCLKLLMNGLRHVVLPQVLIYHDESKSRGLENTGAKKKRLNQEEEYMKQRWGSFLKHDPFYNPHLTRFSEDFKLNPHSIYYHNPHVIPWWKKWLYWKK